MQKRDGCAAEVVDVCKEKVSILKEQKHTKVKHHRNSKTSFFNFAVATVALDCAGSKKVHNSTCNHNRKVLNFTPGVEDKACNGDNAVFVFVWYDVIYKQYNRQKPEQKEYITENQFKFLRT